MARRALKYKILRSGPRERQKSMILDLSSSWTTYSDFVHHTALYKSTQSRLFILGFAIRPSHMTRVPQPFIYSQVLFVMLLKSRTRPPHTNDTRMSRMSKANSGTLGRTSACFHLTHISGSVGTLAVGEKQFSWGSTSMVKPLWTRDWSNSRDKKVYRCCPRDGTGRNHVQ